MLSVASVHPVLVGQQSPQRALIDHGHLRARVAPLLGVFAQHTPMYRFGCLTLEQHSGTPKIYPNHVKNTHWHESLLFNQFNDLKVEVLVTSNPTPSPNKAQAGAQSSQPLPQAAPRGTKAPQPSSQAQGRCVQKNVELLCNVELQFLTSTAGC